MIQLGFGVNGWQESIAFYQDLNLKTRMLAEDAVREYGKLVLQEIRNILSRETKQHTGRLLESFQEGSPDLIFDVVRYGDVVSLVIGTRVPYAAYLEYGFEFTGPKTVNIWQNEGFKTVYSFHYLGLHFVERAMKSKRYALNFMIGKAMKRAGYKVNFTRVSHESITEKVAQRYGLLGNTAN